MIGVLTLFGETDFQPILKKTFLQNDLLFVCKNAETSVQLIGFLEEHIIDADAVVVAADAVLSEALFDLLDTIINLKKGIRIVVILNGGREQYLKKQLYGFRQRHIDIIFDDKGFDAESLVRFLKKGPVIEKGKGVSQQSEEKTDGSAYEAEEVSAEKVFVDSIKQENEECCEAENEFDCQNTAEENYTDDDSPEMFSNFHGHYSIGIMGASHGTGVTSLAMAIGEYFALHNCSVGLVDYTGSDALSLARLMNTEYVFETKSMKQIKKNYNLVIVDFGAPYSITPKGDNFILEHGYPIMNIPEFNKCDIKIIMGFSDSWNVRKLMFFLENEQWKSFIDSSYVFLTPDKAHKLKRIYPDVNILNRSENVADIIYEIIKQEEAK